MRVVPRDVALAVMAPRLRRERGKDHDLVALRVVATGKRRGREATVGWELIDRYDEQHGISAMMRTTGYSLSITGQMQVERSLGKAGAFTPDECIPALPYIEALATRGVVLKAIGD